MRIFISLKLGVYLILISIISIQLLACGSGGKGDNNVSEGGYNNGVPVPVDPKIDINNALGFNDNVQSIALANDGSGDVYVGGRFISYSNTIVNRLVRLNDDGSLDSGFITGSGFIGAVQSIAPAVDGSGDIYVGGFFTSYNGTAVNRLLRLNSDGTIDSNFDTLTGSGFDSYVQSIAPATDGSGDVYVGGWFTRYNGNIVNSLVRLNSDGSIDSSFNTLAGSGFNSYVQSIVPTIDGSGDVYIGGFFTDYNGSRFNSLVRLNNDGSPDTDFITGKGFDNIVLSIALASDGSGDIYVGGWFTRYNGVKVNSLVRLDSGGNINSVFNTLADGGFGGLNNWVQSITPVTDGSGNIYVGGWFTSYNGTPARYIVRLNSDASTDSNFVTGKGFSSAVRCILPAMDVSGRVYVGGGFTSYNNTRAKYLVRLYSNGSIDKSFDTLNGFNGAAQSFSR